MVITMKEETMSLLIKNGVVLDPSADQVCRRDVYIDRGVIQDEIPDGARSDSIQILDAAGVGLCQGLSIYMYTCGIPD